MYFLQFLNVRSLNFYPSKQQSTQGTGLLGGHLLCPLCVLQLQERAEALPIFHIQQIWQQMKRFPWMLLYHPLQRPAIVRWRSVPNRYFSRAATARESERFTFKKEQYMMLFFGHVKIISTLSILFHLSPILNLR